MQKYEERAKLHLLVATTEDPSFFFSANSVLWAMIERAGHAKEKNMLLCSWQTAWMLMRHSRSVNVYYFSKTLRQRLWGIPLSAKINQYLWICCRKRLLCVDAGAQAWYLASTLTLLQNCTLPKWTTLLNHLEKVGGSTERAQMGLAIPEQV